MVMTLVILALCIALPVLGVAHIAEQRRRGRAEREAIDSEQRFRQLAESSFDMIVRFDPRTQRRTYVSPASRRLYGYEPEEALAMSAEEVIHPEDVPKVREALRRLEYADHAPITYRGRRKDGTYIWVEASLTRSNNPETGASCCATRPGCKPASASKQSRPSTRTFGCRATTATSSS